MAATCEVRDPDTRGSGEQDPSPREDVPSSPEENPGKTRGRKRRRRKARLTGLSQQRQAANARERYRTKSVQDALQQLSCCIPTPVPTPATKLSKIEILRLASQYIEHLTNVLNENDPSGPGASKARPEDDTGAVKTKGSSRSRRARSRQTKDEETVVYLTRRRMKDMQPEEKGLTDATESNVEPTHDHDDKSCQQMKTQSSNHGKGGTFENNQKDLEQITAQNVKNKALGSDSESRHCKGSNTKHLQTGSKETGNGNSGRPYNVHELDAKLSEVESRRVVSETCAQVSCTKYAVRGPTQCGAFRNTTGNGSSGDKLHHPPYLFLHGNGVSGLPDCRHQTLHGFGVSQAHGFTSCQMTDFSTGRGASGFADYSGFHCAMMPRPSHAQYGQNLSFESDDSNLSISR